VQVFETLIGSPVNCCCYVNECLVQVFETLIGSPVNCCCYVSECLVACGTQDSTVHCIDLRSPRFLHIFTIFIIQTFTKEQLWLGMLLFCGKTFNFLWPQKSFSAIGFTELQGFCTLISITVICFVWLLHENILELNCQLFCFVNPRKNQF